MPLKSRRLLKREEMKILIADDDLVTRVLLRKTLERSGYEVVAVENGRMALECLSTKGGPKPEAARCC
jgi:two-component system, cell cycle response regulator